MIYKAHGSNASWQWLAMITPCIDILRRLASQIHIDLGSRQGVKHTSPELDRDVNELTESLSEQAIYTYQPGRVIDTDKPIVPNAVAEGWNQLFTPLNDFNNALRRLQARCRMTPIVGQSYVDGKFILLIV